MGEIIIKNKRMNNKKDLLNKYNEEFKTQTPFEIISWVLSFANNPVVTTNFRPYEASILHATTKVLSDIKVIWCDTGYNTPETYKNAQEIINALSLNIKLYTPKQTTAYRNSLLGIPGVEDKNHELFSEQVKLEPFRRAMNEHKPDVWFTNIRKGQTSLRDELNIFSFSKDGILKVSPFYFWSDEKLNTYLKEYNLPNEFNYYDPTKASEKRECGIHL